MKPSPFELLRPVTLIEVLDLLYAHRDDVQLIAGGQSLVPMMNLRMATPAVLIDLNTVPELAYIRLDGDVLRIGAMTRQQTLLESNIINMRLPLMARAIQHIGHYQTRSRGTIGGSLANADPSAELALIAVTSSARMRIVGRDGYRLIDATEFFHDAMSTALRQDELLLEIEFPVASAGEVRIAFHEHARRHGDFAIASAATMFDRKSGYFRAGVGAVGAVPHLCRLMADAVRNGAGMEGLESIVDAEIDQIEPISDVHTSATYRRELGRQSLLECLRRVFE